MFPFTIKLTLVVHFEPLSVRFSMDDITRNIHDKVPWCILSVIDIFFLLIRLELELAKITKIRALERIVRI